MCSHPRADTNVAVKDLHNAIYMYENDDPNTLSIVAGDFNQANVVGIMQEYKQYATCPSRNNRILDHCYCQVKRACKSVSCYCDADRTTIMVIPIYEQQLKRCRPKTITVDVWMPEAIERLEDCFENTDWYVFKEGNNLHIFTDTVSAYIKFSQGVCFPSKSVTNTQTAVHCVTRQSMLETKVFEPNPVIQNFFTELRAVCAKQSGKLRSTEELFIKEVCIQ